MHQFQKNTIHSLFSMLLLWLIALGLPAFAQTDTTWLTPQLIKPEMMDSYFGKRIRYFVDKSSQMDLEAVKQQVFIPFEDGNAFRDVKAGVTTWFRWSLQSDLPYDTELLLGLGSVSKLTIFIEYADGRLTTKNTGVLVPASVRDVRLYGGAVKLFLPKGQPVHLWVKAQAEEFDQKIFFRLINLEKAILKQAHFNLREALLQGALWMMFLYHLLLLLATRDKAYFYYIGYIFTSNMILLITTIPHELGLGAWLPYQHLLFFGLLGTIALWYISFIRHFLQTKLFYPDIDQWSRRYIAMRLIWMGAVLGAYTNKWLLYDFVNLVVVLTVVTDIIAGIVFSRLTSKLRLNSQTNFYISLGSAFLFVGGGLSTVLPYLDLPAFIALGDWTFSYFQVGLFVQILVFSFGLGFRNKQIEQEKQKAQADLIEQLEANKALQTQVNRELEQKVNERTAALREANEEIKQINEEIQQTNEKLVSTLSMVEFQHNEILSSINYARRIQTALLPSEQKLRTLLPQAQLFYEPKDIVSGDFYWCSQQGNQVLLAVADCTGHGVPGAFMTVIGINLLEQIVNVDNITAPAAVLTELDNRLRKTLQQQGIAHEDINDGMDISLLSLDFTTGQALWAGAKRPLWCLPAGDTQFIEHKGDKFPIGSSQYAHKTFTVHALAFHPGDTWFCFTDGYADQFGAEGKLTIKRFREMLIQSHLRPDPINIWRNYLDNWRGAESQTDDVLVIRIGF